MFTLIVGPRTAMDLLVIPMFLSSVHKFLKTYLNISIATRPIKFAGSKNIYYIYTNKSMILLDTFKYLVKLSTKV